MSRSNSCMVCTYLIELVAGIMTGYIFIYLDDAIVMRFALSMLYIPAVLVLVDAKSKAVRFLVYLILTAVCLWGVFYAIYWRRPFGFSLIFCGHALKIQQNSTSISVTSTTYVTPF